MVGDEEYKKRIHIATVAAHGVSGIIQKEFTNARRVHFTVAIYRITYEKRVIFK